MNAGLCEKSPGTCYVMYTRVTNIKNIYLPHGALERITTKITQNKGFKDRVNEEKRLLSMEERTIAFIDQMGL